MSKVLFENSNSPLNFEVVERNLATISPLGSIQSKVTSHKAIAKVIDDPNGRGTIAGPILGIVGKGYKVIQNKDIFTTIDTELEKALAPAQLKGVQIKDSIAYDGAWCMRQYIFPEIGYELEYANGAMGNSTKLAFRIIVIHSFDGTSSLKVLSGAIDFFCTNGTIRGEYDQLIQRHTSGLSLPKIGERIAASLNIFWLQRDVFKRWAKRTITNSTAFELINKLPGMSERRAKLLYDQWIIESVQRGPTVWALYSALTYFSSHNSTLFPLRNTGDDHAALTLHKREMQVRGWVEHPMFQSVANTGRIVEDGE